MSERERERMKESYIALNTVLYILIQLMLSCSKVKLCVV